MATDKLLKQVQKNQLIKLNLSGKNLTLARMQILVEALSQSDCKLKKLDLSHCIISAAEKEAILIALASALQKNRSLVDVNLFLDFDFSENVTQALTQALNLNQTITVFHVNLKHIPLMALHSITSALQDNQMLQEKATIYTPQFFKLATPTSSRQGSAEHLFEKQIIPSHP